MGSLHKSLAVREALPAGADTARGHGCAATDPEIRRAHYAALGRKGGAKTRILHGREFYEDIGRAGGETAYARHGTDFYRRIGAIGGKAKRP